MKAILLAGGYATRLWPLTRSIPKPLLPLGGKKVASYIVDELEDLEEINEIIISTNLRFKQEFESWARDHSYHKIRVVEEKTREEEEKLGTIGALAQFIDEIDEDVLVVAGDNYFPFNFNDFIDYYKKVQSPTIATYELKNKEKAKKYGVLELSEENQVTSFVEKPEDPPSSTVSVACYLFTASSFQMINQYLKGRGNPDEPGRFIEWLHTRKPVYGFRFTERGFDIGTPHSYIEAFKALTPENEISNEAKIEDSVEIRPPVLIQGNTTISGESRIGPYVHLQSGTQIDSSLVSDSIIFEDCQIKNSSVSWSLLGKNSKIKELELKNSVIGDYTKALH